ncbi:MAG: T9SS type A sorting domain-containing protein [Bacteroidia bacterium]|nr:T9SS type A sorting domain-containing protein [Bacteroidia bacterium]MCC6768067.1 T9SS type A sorting domain-containing protein [Bacteroidia bacterium]
MLFRKYRLNHLFLLLILCLAPGYSAKAAFSMGFMDFTLKDPDRSNREIPIRVWYPAESQGLNALPAKGNFPVISFAHGWGMGPELYQPLVNKIVPVGYIMLMIGTETKLFIPDQAALGKDLIYALTWFRNQSNDNSSVFSGRSSGKHALMGHSMGGGASILSGNKPELVNMLVLLAPANTEPSSLAAAPSVTAPTIIFSGSGDAVTTPSGMHQPIFQALASSCKFFINIKGGNHCFYADDDPAACNIMEMIAGSQTQIEREDQQDITLDLMIPAMNFFLKDDQTSMEIFMDSVSRASRTEITGGCDPQAIEKFANEASLLIFPQPADNWLRIKPHVLDQQLTECRVFDLSGQLMLAPFEKSGRELVLQTNYLVNGLYLLEISTKGRQAIRRLIQVDH